MGILEKLTAPLKGLGEWQKQQAAAAAERERMEREQVQARRQAFLNDLMRDFSDAEHLQPKHYRELSIGEAKAGKTPAVEYLHTTGTVRLYNLLPGDVMRQASLIKAYGMRYDDLQEGEVGEIIDVKPKDQAPIEYGAVNLGPVPEFKNAEGTAWRFFVELSYNPSGSAGRSGILTRRFIADCEL